MPGLSLLFGPIGAERNIKVATTIVGDAVRRSRQTTLCPTCENGEGTRQVRYRTVRTYRPSRRPALTTFPPRLEIAVSRPLFFSGAVSTSLRTCLPLGRSRPPGRACRPYGVSVELLVGIPCMPPYRNREIRPQRPKTQSIRGLSIK